MRYEWWWRGRIPAQSDTANPFAEVERLTREIAAAQWVIEDCRLHEQPCNCWMFAFGKSSTGFSLAARSRWRA